MKPKYVFNGYYKINKLNCFTINKTKHKKCIYKNKAVKKEDFIERFVEEASKTILDFPKICWCCTHNAFRQILRDAGLKVYGIDLTPGNISNLIQYWECEDCKTCPEKEECYISEYIKNSCNKNWKRWEGPCFTVFGYKLGKFIMVFSEICNISPFFFFFCVILVGNTAPSRNCPPFIFNVGTAAFEHISSCNYCKNSRKALKALYALAGESTDTVFTIKEAAKRQPQIKTYSTLKLNISLKSLKQSSQIQYFLSRVQYPLFKSSLFSLNLSQQKAQCS